MPRRKDVPQPKPESQLEVLKRLSDWKDQFPDRSVVMAMVQTPTGPAYFGYAEPVVNFAAPPISEEMATQFPTLAPYRERQKSDVEAMITRFQALNTLSQRLKDQEGEELALAHHLAEVQPDDIKARLRDTSASLFTKQLLPDDWGYYGAKSWSEIRMAELENKNKHVKVDLTAEEPKEDK